MESIHILPGAEWRSVFLGVVCQSLPKEGILSVEQSEELVMETLMSANGLRFYSGKSVAKCVEGR